MPSFASQEDDEGAQKNQLQRFAALAAFQQLQQGNVGDAMAIAACHCPAVLEVGPGNQHP
jgi:Holliday junction resolvasome RuvABC endonuclease subunit